MKYGCEAVRLETDWPDGLNSLSWMLATNHDARLRDGAAAVRFAERACQLTEYKDAAILDTLAAAYAEAGRFPEAVATLTKALELLTPRQDSLAEDLRGRFELYQAGKPYRE